MDHQESVPRIENKGVCMTHNDKRKEKRSGELPTFVDADEIIMEGSRETETERSTPKESRIDGSLKGRVGGGGRGEI